MDLNPISHYNPIIAPLIKILDPPLAAGEVVTLYEQNDDEQCAEGNEALLARGSDDSERANINDESISVQEKLCDAAVQNGDEVITEQQYNDEAVEGNEEYETQSHSVVQGQRVRRMPARLQDYICYTDRVDTSLGKPDADRCSGTAYPINKYVTCDKFSRSHRVFLAAVTKEKEPEHFEEAIKNKNWCEAMRTEIDALERNVTWTLEDLPPDKVVIGCKWDHRIKYHADGQVERYKARLVALGNQQVQGVDYTETLAPVAKMVSVRTFLAVAAARG
jgi:Reverse transcriptase (RNA-dependent DNA polymerase)